MSKLYYPLSCNASMLLMILLTLTICNQPNHLKRNALNFIHNNPMLTEGAGLRTIIFMELFVG